MFLPSGDLVVVWEEVAGFERGPGEQFVMKFEGELEIVSDQLTIASPTSFQLTYQILRDVGER